MLWMAALLTAPPCISLGYKRASWVKASWLQCVTSSGIKQMSGIHTGCNAPTMWVCRGWGCHGCTGVRCHARTEQNPRVHDACLVMLLMLSLPAASRASLWVKWGRLQLFAMAISKAAPSQL